MKYGLYEKLLNSEVLKKKIENEIDLRDVDDSEIARVVSLSFQKEIRKLLANKDINKNEITDNLSKILKSEEIYISDDKYKELLAFHPDKNELDNLKKNRPLTSISSTSLLTGTSGPTLVSELNREIKTADRIDLIISFIKFSGLRLIINSLKEFTKTKKLRVITTSYMGASDYKAILELSKLPNTEIKISYDIKRTRLHAKSYYFERETGYSTAYIGSSNISDPALTSGLEWNLKISEYTSEDAIKSLKKTFDIYWDDEEFILFDPNSEEHRKQLITSLKYLQKGEVDENYLFFDLHPYSHQKIILEDLKFSRDELKSNRNLVVAATGTGKTMVAAFDYKDYKKENDKSNILFLAHRKEILEQSLFTFRNVLRDQNFGNLWVGEYTPDEKVNLFASIQTMNSSENYLKFDKDYFDYIVIDESHHASSSTYLRLLEYFEPKILLGLTATPERMDGADILSYFDDRIASEIRLHDAVNQKLLSPFHYFAVTDPEDLSHLKWTRGGYEVSQLENVYTKSKQRVQVIIDSMNKYLNDIEDFKAIGFCVSIEHAKFMEESFNKANIPSISLHSNSTREERKNAKSRLASGEIRCIFTVDLFNEGVDIPEIDTVLFLRPTESLTIFIQQLGRGLRLSEGKEVLTVLDYVGQAHKNYDFSPKLRALIGKTSGNIEKEIINEFPNMPAGCHIELEKQAQEYILKNIQSSTITKLNMKNLLKNFEINFDNELNLKNFLDNYGIDIIQFYSKKFTFYELLNEVNLLEDYKGNKEFNISFSRISNMNSRGLINFLKNLLINEIDYNELNKQETRKLSMVYYTIWNNPPEYNFSESFENLKKDYPQVVEEFLEILNYKLEKIDRKEIPYADDNIPLDIYSSYYLDQITASVGKTHENYKYPLREGTFYIEEINTDIFFITINKNEEDYLPTTMYNDYAINSKYFNWESQNNTSINSKTGKRYISNDPNHKVLLFVRDEKKQYGQTKPYTFIGNAKIKSYKGSNPIEIIWEMENEIPEKIIQESKLSLG